MKWLLKQYKKISCTDWQIVFAENTLNEIVRGDSLKLHVMKHAYKDRWFADPFILDVNDREIQLLAECVTDDTQRGRIAFMSVDKKTYALKNMEFVLDLPTHLSFPVIFRNKDRIFVYPENGDAGALDLYEFDLCQKKFLFKETIMGKALGDAIILENIEDCFLFATEAPDMNGRYLSIYKRNDDKSWNLYQKVCFPDNIARMAGNFFSVNNKTYRPAQECNLSYGHGLVIQEVIFPNKSENKKWNFKDIRRMTSPLKRYPLCLHTLNCYKNLVVMDVKGYRFYILGSFINWIKTLIFRDKYLEHRNSC